MTETCRGTCLTDFEPLEKIGEGSFSSVYKVRRIADSQVYALKKVKLSHLSQRDVTNSLNEARILASIESSFVVKYRQAFYDDGANALCIVMEWADGGDLQKQLTRQSQQPGTLVPQCQIWKAAAQILSGLQLLHSKGILHRDLKTANIFICGGSYKIGDMNVSKVQSQQMAYTQTGTPYYASPEVWRDQPYDARSDIWSFGCIIYQMCTLHPPFQGKDIESLYKRIKKGKFQKIPDCYSNHLRQLIDLCLHQNAQQRPTAKSLTHHPDSILLQKCTEYGITLQKSNSLTLIKTINYHRSFQGFQADLPKARYERNEPLKNKTEETMGQSHSDNRSPNLELKSARPLKKDRKLTQLKKVPQKRYQTGKALKTSQERHSSSSSMRTDKFKSMKNMLEKAQLPRLPKDNQSHKQIVPLIDLPHLYPKYSRARNLTTERREVTQESNEIRQLDVIKQIRKRLDVHSTKAKKAISGQFSNKALFSQKKKSFVNLTKDEQDSKLSLKGLKGNFQSDVLISCLRKVSKRSKNYGSNPYMKRPALTRVQSDMQKIQAIVEESNTHRKHRLKKKPNQHRSPQA